MSEERLQMIKYLSFKKQGIGTSPVVQWSGLHFPVQGAQVPSLVRELRSHKPPGQKKKHKKENRSDIVTNSTDFQDGSHKKKKAF